MINNKIDNKINVRTKLYSIEGLGEALYKFYLCCFLPDTTMVAKGTFNQTLDIRVFIHIMNNVK